MCRHRHGDKYRHSTSGHSSWRDRDAFTGNLSAAECHHTAEAELLVLDTAGLPREVLMGVGDGVASVIMLTFTKRPGPHADTAWAVVG